MCSANHPYVLREQADNTQQAINTQQQSNKIKHSIMAVDLDPILAGIHGAVVKHGAIHRRKILRDSRGRIIKKCKNELYKVEKPRDFNECPQTGDELAHRVLFQNAIYHTRDILAALKPENNPTQEQLDTLQHWKTRFEAQIPGIRGKKADPEAPIDSKTGKAKRYYQLNTFIRAIIYHQLKSQALTPETPHSQT